jgi:hypothetical protein
MQKTEGVFKEISTRVPVMLVFDKRDKLVDQRMKQADSTEFYT